MKVNLAGVVCDTIATTPDPVTLEQLHAACVAAGLDVTVEQVYAGTQSLASRRRIARAGNRTYCRLDEVPDSPAALVRGERVRTRTKAHHPSETVIEAVRTELGPSVPRPRDRYAFCVVLLGDHPADFILMRAHTVLGERPREWFEARQGDNVMLGFLL